MLLTVAAHGLLLMVAAHGQLVTVAAHGSGSRLLFTVAAHGCGSRVFAHVTSYNNTNSHIITALSDSPNVSLCYIHVILSVLMYFLFTITSRDPAYLTDKVIQGDFV